MTRFTERVERDLEQIAGRATPSSTAWEAIQQRIDDQDITEPTSEVIMLAPERHESPTKNPRWMMVAAAVAALALIGGLIVAATRTDEDPVPADQPEPTLPAAEPETEAAAPTPVALGLELPVTVTYLDLEWELQEVVISPQVDITSTEPDDDVETDYVHTVLYVTNPMVDYALPGGISQSGLTRLDVPGLEQPLKADEIWDEANEPSKGNWSLEPEQSITRTWSFPVPAGTDVSGATLVVTLDGGRDAARPQLIPFPGPVPVEPEGEVVFAETSVSGPYSNGNVDFEVINSFGSFNRGLYPDNRARPGQSDRRAERGEVFVIVELEATSVDDIGGVEPGAHVIVTDDGTEHPCMHDAPETYGEETVVYTVSCAVPLTATSYTFQMSSDKCAEGESCPSIDHAIVIDPSFVEPFQ